MEDEEDEEAEDQPKEEDVGDAATRICTRSSRLRSESAAEARRRLRQEMEVAEEAEMLAYMDEFEQQEDELEPSYMPIQPAPGTIVMDISNNKD